MTELSGGLPFEPTTLSKLQDYLHRARLYADSVTSPRNVLHAFSPFVGGGASAALGGASQGDILNNHPNKFAGAPAYNMMGGPTLPSTAQPLPSGMNTPAAPPPPPALSYPMGGDPMTAGGTPTPPQAPTYPMGGDPMTAGIAPSVSLPASRPSVPMPMARPADAPQAPAPMGFFARNTAMMRDPISGDFLDPAAAQKADATGPDVIQKFMNYFHNKDVA